MFTNMDPSLLTLVLGTLAAALLGLIVLFIGISRYLKSKNKVTSRLEHYVTPKRGLTSGSLRKKSCPGRFQGPCFNEYFPLYFPRLLVSLPA